MNINGNNNYIINHSKNTKVGSVKKKRITIISILAAISLLIGIYIDAYDHIVKYFNNSEPALNYDHATFGNDTKKGIE